MEYINSYQIISIPKGTIIPVCKLESSETVYKLMTDEYHMDKFFTEEMWGVFLDAKLNIIGVHQISKGGLSATMCEPRSVFVPALLANAAGIVLVHNHPSGDPNPSKEDFSVTDRIHEIGKLLQINLVDHIVIGKENNYYSFKNHGFMEG